jgi:hypothetical protein
MFFYATKMNFIWLYFLEYSFMSKILKACVTIKQSDGK